MFNRILNSVILLAVSSPTALAREHEWESLPDGSTGHLTLFSGAGGVKIAAYIRKLISP